MLVVDGKSEKIDADIKLHDRIDRIAFVLQGRRMNHLEGEGSGICKSASEDALVVKKRDGRNAGRRAHGNTIDTLGSKLLADMLGDPDKRLRDFGIGDDQKRRIIVKAFADGIGCENNAPTLVLANRCGGKQIFEFGHSTLQTFCSAENKGKMPIWQVGFSLVCPVKTVYDTGKGETMAFLHVRHDDRIVGVLSGTREEVSFRYDPEWIQDGFALSLALPLRYEAYGNEETRAYFSNLMPEDRILAMLCRAGKLAGHDLMSFFRRYGRECAGAIVLLEEENVPDAEEERDITDKVLAYLAEETGDPLSLAVRSHLSLAGAQDKLPVIIRDGRFFLSSEPTTHIIKPDIPGYPHSARNEHFCLEFAAALGCRTVKSRLMQFPEGEVLAVKRYDRREKNGKTVRLHQQDFCQALGLPSICKYQGQGEFFGFPQMVCTCAKHHVLIDDFLAKARIVNWIVGNCDAHAKNFSLVTDENGITFAPLYDILCTTIYPGLDREMGMAFGRHLMREDVDKNDISGMEVGVEDEEHRALARRMAEEGPDMASSLAKMHTRIFGPCPVYAKIVDEINDACGKLLILTEKAGTCPRC